MKIKGTIGSTDRALDFMQKLHAERSGEDQCHPLNLELVIRQKEIQVVIDIHATAPLVGYLPHSLSVVLLPLMVDFPLVRMQTLTFSPFEEVTERQGKRSRGQARNIRIFINIYGNPTIRSRIGLFLSKNSVFLQHPKFPEPGYPYRNPHVLSRPGATIYITKSILTGGVTPEDNSIMDTKDEVSVHLASLSHIFDDLCGSKTQGELPGDMRYLKTPLLKYVQRPKLVQNKMAANKDIRHQEQGLYFLAMREQVKQNSSHHGT